MSQDYNCHKISCNGIQDLKFYKKSEKIVTTASPIKLRWQSLYQYHPSKLVYCMQDFVWFHATESEIELPEEFWGKCNSSATYRAIYTQIASLLFLMISILYIKFCAISSTGNRDQLIPKIPEKVKLQHDLSINFH